MAAQHKLAADLKWNVAQRLQYIEIMAYYAGVVTRSDVAKTFGLSDAAATKDLKLYSELAPDNLLYKHAVFGFVPGPAFVAVFADLSPAVVLPLIASNLAAAGGPYEQHSVYGISVDTLPLPVRLPDKSIVAQVVRAAHHRKKLQIRYNSMSDRDPDRSRIIEPHALIDTGLRWHIRAYSEEHFDFRDYVLSRISEARMLDQDAESGPAYDDDWVESITLSLAPHPGLTERKRNSLMIDYGAVDGVIKITVRRALLGYTLQRMSVDTSADHSLNPDAYHLIIVNRDEIETYAGWAFLQ